MLLFRVTKLAKQRGCNQEIANIKDKVVYSKHRALGQIFQVYDHENLDDQNDECGGMNPSPLPAQCGGSQEEQGNDEKWAGGSAGEKHEDSEEQQIESMNNHCRIGPGDTCPPHRQDQSD
ncbi:MAG: hypothetical protein STSR0002_18890 [Smithella sp.]